VNFLLAQPINYLTFLLEYSGKAQQMTNDMIFDDIAPEDIPDGILFSFIISNAET
jgi:hypothetical protein